MPLPRNANNEHALTFLSVAMLRMVTFHVLLEKKDLKMLE